MAQQTHQSDPRVLNRRTLEQDHRVLAGLLRPGMSVLDVGCGTGAITAGIARAVAPGETVGLDRDASLLDIARRDHAGAPHLTFQQGDALSMEFEARFDVATAARAVQWMADPAAAIRRMAAAVKPGGLVVVLDYNHEDASWSPDPPAEWVRFYDAFLRWRERSGWANQMGNALPALFAQAGLVEIESHVSDETAARDTTAASIMLHVIDSMGPQFATAEDCAAARQAFEEYARARLERQALVLRTVVGRGGPGARGQGPARSV